MGNHISMQEHLALLSKKGDEVKGWFFNVSPYGTVAVGHTSEKKWFAEEIGIHQLNEIIHDGTIPMPDREGLAKLMPEMEKALSKVVDALMEPDDYTKEDAERDAKLGMNYNCLIKGCGFDKEGHVQHQCGRKTDEGRTDWSDADFDGLKKAKRKIEAAVDDSWRVVLWRWTYDKETWNYRSDTVQLTEDLDQHGMDAVAKFVNKMYDESDYDKIEVMGLFRFKDAIGIAAEMIYNAKQIDHLGF